MKKISVVLATYNEEKNIARCLESVKELADEIIIVDGSSTDKTVEIAKKFGAKVTVTDNPPNFHINKQKAIDKATKDWILQMDADEVVSPELAKEIQSKIDDRGSEVDVNGYWMPRKNFFLGRFLMKGGQYPDYTIRLYKKGKGKLPVKDVHEQAMVEGMVKYLTHALLHYPYKNFAAYLTKWKRYNKLEAGNIRKDLENKSQFKKFLYGIGFLIIKPAHWFLTTYLRHKGFMDSWQGFTFCLFSALRFPASYLEYLNQDEQEDEMQGKKSSFINKHFILIFFLIIIAAIAFRFYNFHGRWVMGGDDARDIAIAKEAILRGQLPLIGSFSSAGPFVFGPLFYWVLIASYLIFPFSLLSPWVVTALAGVGTVLILMLAAKQIGGKSLAIIAGILVATSPQLVIRSLILGQHTYVSVFASLLVLFFILFWKTKKLWYSFWMGIALGIALSMHYQSLNLLIFFPVLLFIPKMSRRNKVVSLILMFCGFLIPSLPLLIWDAHQGFSNIRNILDYFLIGQYRIYVPNSWRLFIFNYLPSYWSFVVGGISVVAFILMVLSGVLFVVQAVRRKIPSVLFCLGIIMGILLFVNRYYRGERSEGYMMYFAPFIVLFSAWLFWKMIFSQIKNKKIEKSLKYTGIILLLVIVVRNVIKIVPSYQSSPLMSFENNAIDQLTHKYPGKTFTIYNYNFDYYVLSTGLSALMKEKNLTSEHGMRIGVVCYGKKYHQKHHVILNGEWGCPLVDLQGLDNQRLQKLKWFNTNQEAEYDDLITRWETHPLPATFSLQKYLQQKL